MNIDEFVQRIESKTGKSARRSGGNYVACCPAHDDATPSLSISEGVDGKVLVKCFSGCSVDAICAAMGLQVSDLFAEPAKCAAKGEIEYAYCDESGKKLFSKIRIEPGFNGKPKSFYWKRLNEHGQIVKNLKGCRKVLYNLPEVIQGIAEGKPIFLVEGEKDADKLRSYGLVASTAPESLQWNDTFTEVLQNGHVVILYDLDKTGVQRRDMICDKLYGKVKRLRVVDLPGLEYRESHGQDISDWLKLGNTTSQLLELLEKAPDYAPSPQKGKIRAVSMKDFLNMDLPKREMLLAPFLPTQGLCLLYAKRGVGKTHVALGIAYAVATGGKFLKWHAPEPKRVLYIDGEMPAAAMQERLQRIAVTENVQPPDPDYLRLITPDLQEGAMPDLSTQEGRTALQALIDGSDLIIVDNLSSLVRGGVENEAESWQPVQDWALDLRRNGKSILFVHHAAKGGQQRGTSKREDILDAVVVLKHPQGYCANQGACFEVSFEKTRHFSGEDASSFEVQLKEQVDGLWLWEISAPSVDPEVLEVAEMCKEGLTIEKIAEKTGLTKSQVESRKKKAKNQGLI